MLLVNVIKEMFAISNPYPMDSLGKDGKYRLIAYVLVKDTDGSYTVNNVISCSLIEKIDYQYE